MHIFQSIRFGLRFYILSLIVLFFNGCSSEPKQPPRPDTREVNVVVLLPLSGQYAHIGDSYLKAIELALFEFADLNLKAQVLDTKGTFEGALETLKHVKDADVVLGPVMSTAVDAVSMWALKRKIPVISLTNNFTKAQPGVFVFGIPPQSEIEAMVGSAVKNRMERFTAILPSGAFGATMRESLEKTIQAYGASLVDVFFYSPNMDELPSIIKQMQKKTVAGIFVLSGGKELFTISEAIKSAKISGRILGTQQWKASDVIHWRNLSESWYTSGYSAQKQIFENRYFSLYNKEPDVSAYLAYDAMAMLSKLHKLSYDAPFSMTALTSPMGFVGLQGSFSLQKDGSVKRKIAIMEIKDGASQMRELVEGK
ncbi:penicillin-binding protein activator [Candidatus Bodocaedibacter vickermanii]|uniref:Penicillin-binding protein activator LpoA n=1 Tax=Candidatus Bodocaedibacter vickermanii TaxID=2741701 RepID=A0A7L9RU48_9PROT|nr:Penicillin-binding protein activator LpoA [Candidatus Paracaedibacteraceae bacterium 'Lake Konstanz']